MNSGIKHILKKYLKYYKIKDRFNPKVRESQRQLVNDYNQEKESGNLPLLKETGFKLFSQFEEDGLLLYIFSLIGMTNKTFIEFGSDDGINSNTANL